LKFSGCRWAACSSDRFNVSRWAVAFSKSSSPE
jgi:hypothetical protein